MVYVYNYGVIMCGNNIIMLCSCFIFLRVKYFSWKMFCTYFITFNLFISIVTNDWWNYYHIPDYYKQLINKKYLTHTNI